MDKELIKLAASYLDDLLQQNEELENLRKKSDLIEKISAKLVEQNLVTTLDSYMDKVAELNEKTVGDLEHMYTFVNTYIPKMKEEFGKLADASISMTLNNLSAEEQFVYNLINHGGK